MSKRSRRATAQATVRPAAPGARQTDPRPGRAPFVASIALSAFLLFTLELLAGRLVLPVFGGSPGVWTTALVLFTGILFLGYLYAHFVATRLDPRRGGLVQLALAVLVVVATLLAPRDIAALRFQGTPEALNVLYALLLIAGAPIFLLASTTPLLSSWFSGRGGDPWWLYAVSNAASFLALIAYPFVIEPYVPLSTQRTLVVGALVVFGATLAAVVRSGRHAVAEAPTREPDDLEATEPLDRRRQLRWLFAASIPAGLLAATTNFIATDLVSAPLLWVGPLAIYLASFVVAFSRLGRRSLRFVEFLVPAAVTLLWIPFVLHAYLPVIALLLIELGSYAVLAIAIHGRLALDRPDGRHLTRFYLILAAGGLLATAFVALIAPLVFSTIYEYPILLVAGIGVLVILPGPSGRPETVPRPDASRPKATHRREAIRLSPAAPRPEAGTPQEEVAASASVRGLLVSAILRLIPLAIVGIVLFALVASDPEAAPQLVIMLVVGAVIVLLARTPALLAGATAIVVIIFIVGFAPPSLTRVRTFFGVLEVRDPGGPAFAEYSGPTLHGAQFTDGRSREPTTYYVRNGPLGGIFDDLRARARSASIGVVGLGTGTVAAYAQPDDRLTFFEINQAVVDLAEEGKYFTYLRDSAAKPEIIVGDARLSLDAQPDASFDLLILDAFSSDAVPTHLLTREAMRTYMQKLRPGGALAFHVSNRYYSLANAVAGTARAEGLGALFLGFEPDNERRGQIAAYSSEWVVVGKPGDVKRFEPRGWSAIRPGPALTDDFSDLLRTLQPLW